MNQSRVYYQLVALLFVVGLVSLLLVEPPDDLTRAFYRTIGLFLHDSDWVFAKDTASNSSVIRSLAVLMPIVSVFAVATLFFDEAVPLWLRSTTRLRLMVGHSECIALIGLTKQSLDLAISVRGDASKRIVPIIVADDADPSLAKQCAKKHIALFGRHAWKLAPKSRWHPAKPARMRVKHVLNKAGGIVSFLPTADAQLEFVHELQSWQPVIEGAGSRVWILLDDRGLAQRLEDYVGRLVVGATRHSTHIVPRLLTLNMLRARHLLTSQQLDMFADAFGQSRIHVVIYGLGATGRAIVKEVAQLYVTRPSLAGTKLRVTFFDRDAGAAEAALLAEDPGITTVIDLIGCKAEFSPAGLLESQFCLLPNDVTAHVIGFGNTASAVNLAMSLRRWLLEPPVDIECARPIHHAAPIFVRVHSIRGLGRLFCRRPDTASSVAGAPVPDGIFGYGAIEDLFGAADTGYMPVRTILDPDSESGARGLHAAYFDGRPGISSASERGEKRVAERAWEELPSSLRESNFRAYDHIAIKARAIGWRFVPDDRRLPNPRSFENGEKEELARLEHRRYTAERMANGWRFAPQRLDAVRVHPDLVDWDLLNIAEQKLDTLQIDALSHVARAARRRLAPALVIGIVGQRTKTFPAEEVRALLKAELRRLQSKHSHSELILLTSLAPGAGCLIAEAAIELQIPYVAALPLPYELYREDFDSEEEVLRFHTLAAQAELQIEIPLRFGRASELTKSRQPPPELNLKRRNQQYALANAWIVERAHELIAVDDGGLPDNTGDAADAVQWWSGGVPTDYTTPSHFFVRPSSDRPAPCVVKPHSSDDKPGKPHAGHH